MRRPPYVVRVDEIPEEKRPRFLPGAGVGAHVRELRPATGLTRMGVSLRRVEPGRAGTHRHFHTVEEEWVVVLSGTGTVRIGPHRLPVREGSFVAFPPGPRPHHFIADPAAEGSEPLLLLEGGERRRDVDECWYPDLGRVYRKGRLEETAAFPPEEGEAVQCIHVDDLPDTAFQHDVDAGARRVMRSLSRATGLARQAVRWTRVATGDRSTAYHTHDRTDEWLYLLEGRARVRVGMDVFEAAGGDFLGHPAGGPAHVMEPLTDLSYWMGGQIDPTDVVTYPDAGVRRRGGKLEPL